MFLAYVNQADPKRAVEADLRRRRILKAGAAASAATSAGPVRLADGPARATRLRAVEP